MNIEESPSIPLGKTMGHSREYNPGHLFPVPRSTARTNIGITTDLPFHGEDIWNAYELSWINPKGKPVVAIAEITIPCTTENIVESKSLKLYLNSLNQSKFDSVIHIRNTIKKDLSECVNGDISISIILPEEFQHVQITEVQGICIDHIDTEISSYSIDRSFLRTGSIETNETLYSHLLRTNCPVTDQPDWATVVMIYTGKQINHEGLLKYIISFREHTGFHENCVEKIFTDIMEKCKPEQLTVFARFTRRGGIDINPYRSTNVALFKNKRLARQ